MRIWFGLQINKDGNPVIVSASADMEEARNSMNEEIGSRHMLQPVDIELPASDDFPFFEADGTNTVQ